MDFILQCPRVFFILSFNLFRILLRKYGAYLLFSTIIFVLHGLFGYLFLSNNQHYFEETDTARKDYKKYFIKYKQIPMPYDVIKNETEKSKYINDFSSQRLDNFNFTISCDSISKDSLLAIRRAKTLVCKEKIANLSCQIENGVFYPSRLVNSCPYGVKERKFVGCFKDRINDRVMRDYFVSLKRNSPSLCADICYQRGFAYSGVQYSKECFCGNEKVPLAHYVDREECDMSCVGSDNQELKCGGFLRISVYKTGFENFTIKPLKRPISKPIGPSIRIAYILTLNGRSLRQILRLFKTLFHRDHYFYIHVDERQHYLYKELMCLEQTYPNVQLSRQRFSSMWGGTSLLKVLLHCMKELILKKEWRWDFVINLSETDFPLKSNGLLVDFLRANRDRNFLKSHGHDLNKYLRKQGLNITFFECEQHMWRIGSRNLPLGIYYDGGSDWMGLTRSFVDHITHIDDPLIRGLKKIFFHTLLPAETFFHTLLLNSKLCDTFANNNLRLTNWKRKLGCRCQYKETVDWCGCSPNDFTSEDWMKLEGSKNRYLFFGRKFEAVKSLSTINDMDKWMYGQPDTSTLNALAYWDNVYHFEDPPNGKGDVGLTLFNAAMRLASRILQHRIINGEREQKSQESRRLSSSNFELIPVITTQTHTYHFNDQFQGLLVEFLARTKDGATLKFESLIKPKKTLTIFSSHPFSSQIMNAEVNTNFDLKEQIFRNFGGELGPKSEIQLAIWWSEQDSDSVKDDTDKEDQETFQVVLVDPLQAVAVYTTVTANDRSEALLHKFNMETPLRPGIWSLFLIFKEQILAFLHFPVLPLQFIQGRRISVAEARQFHNGNVSTPYPELNDDLIGHIRKIPNLPFSNFSSHGNEDLVKIANQKAAFFDHRLMDWIDEVVSISYFIDHVCRVPSKSHHPSLISSVPLCTEVLWSSHSPDPKSFWGQIDPQSGRFKDSLVLEIDVV